MYNVVLYSSLGVNGLEGDNLENTVNPNSIVPLYVQIVDQLQRDIQNGVFSKSGRLPTEAELSEKYNVSRITVRRAVEQLVSQGFVEKKQGKGTFVCAPKMTRQIDGPMSFTEMCRANGLKASSKILDAKICIAESQEIRNSLSVGENEPVVRIRRLRYAGERPLVLEDNYFPLEYAYLLSIDLENDSVYRFLQEEKGIELRRTAIHLRIIRADTKLSRLLQVPRNAPQLELIGRVTKADGQTVHTSYQVGYGENFEFIVR